MNEWVSLQHIRLSQYVQAICGISCICVGEYDGNICSVSGLETVPTSEGDDGTYSDMTGIQDS